MKAHTVTIRQAKVNLSHLLQKVSQGEKVILLRGIHPKGQRQPGSLKGQLVVGKEFFEPLPPSEFSAWE